MILKKIKDYAVLVMFEHTIFSLAFAVVAMVLAVDMWSLLAEDGGAELAGMSLLALLCLIAGRTGANAINRVIDAEIDLKNPRTAVRQIPQQLVSKREATLFALVCFGVMVGAAWLISPLTGWLSPIALFFLLTYAYTKRFTWLCHVYLGFTCAIAPMGAWIALTGNVFELLPILLVMAQTAWVAGFDMIYACLDHGFDTSHGIHSVPARFGVGGALRMAAGFHAVALGMLLAVGILAPQLGWVYFIGFGLILGLLVYEHLIISSTQLSKVKFAAYGINQVVSLVLLTFTVADVLFF